MRTDIGHPYIRNDSAVALGGRCILNARRGARAVVEIVVTCRDDLAVGNLEETISNDYGLRTGGGVHRAFEDARVDVRLHKRERLQVAACCNHLDILTPGSSDAAVYHTHMQNAVIGAVVFIYRDDAGLLAGNQDNAFIGIVVGHGDGYIKQTKRGRRYRRRK